MSKHASHYRKHRLSLNTRVIAIISIALPLLILGWVVVIKLAQLQLDKQVREEVTFTLLLQADTTPEEAQALLQNISKEPFVKEAKYISPEMAAIELEKEMGENPQNVLGYNPLQPSIEVHLKAQYTSPEKLPAIDKQIRTWRGVDNLTYRGDMLEVVDMRLRQFSQILLILSGLLLLIAIIQVNNTTHLLIYTRRFLIRTMTLLGAKKMFISRPFIGYSVLNGFWGGLLATCLVGFSIWFLQHAQGPDLLQFLPHSHLMLLAVSLPAIGMILSAITAFFSTAKYIRMESGKLILR